jgi:microcystin-dependent protein
MPVKRWRPSLRWVGGSLVCNGAELRAHEFPDLFAIMGHTYGGFGDYFNIPLFGEARVMPLGGKSLTYCMTQQGQIWMSANG